MCNQSSRAEIEQTLAEKAKTEYIGVGFTQRTKRLEALFHRAQTENDGSSRLQLWADIEGILADYRSYKTTFDTEFV